MSRVLKRLAPAALLLLMACRSARPPVAFAGQATQHLFRVEVTTRDEHDTLRLALRLWRPRRFELVVSDPIGRVAGSLEVSESGARWIARRGGSSCRFDPDTLVVFADVALALPAETLPQVLLGRLPRGERDRPQASAADGSFQRTDADGGVWTFEMKNGVLQRWRHEETGRPAVLWQRLDATGAKLAVEDGSLELRWRETASEPLAAGPPPWKQVDDEPECAGADLS